MALWGIQALRRRWVQRGLATTEVEPVRFDDGGMWKNGLDAPFVGLPPLRGALPLCSVCRLS
jgi:hypothetical protein